MVSPTKRKRDDAFNAELDDEFTGDNLPVTGDNNKKAIIIACLLAVCIISGIARFY